MELTDRQLIRIAERIRDCLTVLRNSHCISAQQLIQNVSSDMERLEIIRCGLCKTVRFNWSGATAKLTSNAQRVLRDMPYSIAEADRAIETSRIDVPTLRQVYEELNQSREEFGRLQYNADEDTLSVFTEVIELQGYFLGDFEIRLQISKLAQMQEGNIFNVIALDPHPAATNDSVTHPHVSDEHLCAGDANAAIHSAIANGRICDFFMLVRSVLETYNPSSPYVSLDDWEGITCYECGYTASEDSSFCCESCDNTYCDECMSYCRSCDTSLCQACLRSCQFCEEPCCEGCMQSCSECEEPLCSSCIEDNLCPTCHEERENQTDENEQNETDEPTETTQQEVA